MFTESGLQKLFLRSLTSFNLFLLSRAYDDGRGEAAEQGPKASERQKETAGQG